VTAANGASASRALKSFAANATIAAVAAVDVHGAFSLGDAVVIDKFAEVSSGKCGI